MTASSSRRCLLRAVLCLTAGSTGLFGCVGRAGAQTQATPVAGVPSTDVPSALKTPGPTMLASDFVDIIDAAAAEGATGSRALLPGHAASQFLGGGRDGLARHDPRVDVRKPEGPVEGDASEHVLQRRLARALVLLSPQHHGRPPAGLDQRV